MNPKKSNQGFTNNKKQPSKKPDPSRFEMYSVLEDQTGFKVLGSDHIFYFDVYGGWFDEYENYYDADGVPRTPPTYSDEEDPAEDLAEEYEDEEDEDVDDQILEQYDQIYTNTQNKKVVEANIPEIEIEFEVKNINWKTKFSDFGNFLKKNNLKWISLDFGYDKMNRFTGTAYIIFEKSEAPKFIALNGKEFEGRPLRILALKPELLKDKDDVDVDHDEDDDEYEGEEHGPIEETKEEERDEEPGVEFEVKDINLEAKEDDFENFLRQKNLKWTFFEFDYDNEDKFTGYAYITFDETEADKFLALNGTEFQGKTLGISIYKEEHDEVHKAGEEGKIEEHKTSDEKN